MLSGKLRKEGRMMRYFILTIILGMCLSTPAKSEVVALRGVGTKSCAEFAADFKRDPRSAKILYMSWALGFLSSQNIANALAQKPMRGLPEPSSIERNILQDCDYRPLAPFFEIVLDIFKSQPESKT
jgi:hypothetical protein